MHLSYLSIINHQSLLSSYQTFSSPRSMMVWKSASKLKKNVKVVRLQIMNNDYLCLVPSSVLSLCNNLVLLFSRFCMHLILHRKWYIVQIQIFTETAHVTCHLINFSSGKVLWLVVGGTGNFRKECWTPPTTIGFHISWSVRSDLSKVKFYLNFLKSKNILVTTFLIWWCSRNTEKRSACVWIHFQLSILYEQNKMVLFL